ncbi:hypothetical protein KKF91_22525 [Myxococcota bacterium]|nr:hypothetical protein [Myxococcota bacterium]
MSQDSYARFHQAWLGMAQPSEGLVFSVPVLADADIMNRGGAATRRVTLKQALNEETGRLESLSRLLCDLLGYEWGESLLDRPPEDLRVTTNEGGQTLRPTHLLKSPQTGAQILLWWLPLDPKGQPLSMDKPEEVTGPWRYPPSAKMTRLLHGLDQEIGLLINPEAARLFYAPKDGAVGWIEFRFSHMADPGGAPLLEAFTLLLNRHRALSKDSDGLRALMRASRDRQADLTDALAAQVLDALSALLEGFDHANSLDPYRPLDDALAHGDVYGGLLTVMLRLIFLLYAEAHELLPVEHPIYQRAYSVLALYDQLIDDAGRHPDEMGQRFGAWPQLLATFRALYEGGSYDGAPPLDLPPRRGQLFDPDTHPWLEGRALNEGHSLLNQGAQLPRVDDQAILTVLHSLLSLKGQRLSYKALGVEELGGVYERLMGFSAQRALSPALKLKGSGAWITAPEVLEIPQGQRAKWLHDDYALSGPQSRAAAKALKGLTETQAILDALRPFAVKGDPKPAGALLLQPGHERRRTSSHYTPRSLSSPVVKRALEPVLRSFGEAPTPEQILSLSICDPAMGSGAFLVESCRALADELVAAWARTKETPEGPDPRAQALRVVARRCLYGVDKNALAVSLARLSLWLLTFSRELPFTFLDHALRHGDSLVGLSVEQIEGLHWAPKVKKTKKGQIDLISPSVSKALIEARRLRAELAELSDDVGYRQKARLLDDVREATASARLLADGVVAAFFGEEKNAGRVKTVKALRTTAEAWLSGQSEDAKGHLKRLQAELEEVTFHWPLEFPEVFERGGFDVIVGNPPFLGGSHISSNFGGAYRDWLFSNHPGSHGKADIVAHFFRRVDFLTKKNAVYGLIATNTISQGDTRESGIGFLVKCQNPKREIFSVLQDLAWPGNAAVTVSVVHLLKHLEHSFIVQKTLNNENVDFINSQFKPKEERPCLSSLNKNNGIAYKGSFILGQGFTLTPDECNFLIELDPKNNDRIFPYLGGREINSSPIQEFERYVISFGEMSLEEAHQWTDLIRIIEEKVKPERDNLKDNTDGRKYKKYWWRFGRSSPALYAALKPLKRCLVTARVTKHLVFAWQPADRIFSEQLYAFPREDDALFSVLQSRVHEPWAWLHSSQMKTDLRYSPTDCLANFAFPEDMSATALHEAGAALYEARAAYMIERQEGLTKTYNRLKDPNDRAPEIEALRRLHEAMDKAVLRAYGWDDLIEKLPPYGAPSLEFDDEVIDRLFALNAARAKGEAGAAPKPKPKAPRGRKPKVVEADDPQCSLFGRD